MTHMLGAFGEGSLPTKNMLKQLPAMQNVAPLVTVASACVQGQALLGPDPRKSCT